MFSILFPGQGSQNVGMGKELFQNFDYVKNYFNEANELLDKNLTNISIVEKHMTLRNINIIPC